MIKLATWNVYQADGRYLGQQHAFAPEVAFCQFMALKGETVSERELRLRADAKNNSFRFEHKREEFVLRANQYAEATNI